MAKNSSSYTKARAAYLAEILRHPRLSNAVKETVRKMIDQDYLIFGSMPITPESIPTLFPRAASRLTKTRFLAVSSCIETVVEVLGGEQIADEIKRSAFPQSSQNILG